MSQEHKRIDREQLPSDYPTHRHSSEFWEQLDRAVATYGFLEEVLGRAIFALFATREYGHAELEQAYSKWPGQLERALFDPLGNLIHAYDEVLKNHPKLPVSNPEQLIGDLGRAAKLRNVLCHGSWQVPDGAGKSLPMFVDKKLNMPTCSRSATMWPAWPVRSWNPSAVLACSFPDRPVRARSYCSRSLRERLREKMHD